MPRSYNSICCTKPMWLYCPKHPLACETKGKRRNISACPLPPQRRILLKGWQELSGPLRGLKMKVKNKKGIAILLGVLCMFILGGFLLASGKNQAISTTNKTNNMDEAVGMAIKEQGKGYSEG